MSSSSSSSAPGGSAQPARGAASSDAYRNPVYDSNFPDPGVIRVGETYYAFGTQGASSNIQTLTSQDLVHWTPGPDALPELGSWANFGNTWAPEVIQIGDEFHMYYVARGEKQGVQCIGHAVSSTPVGPYHDDNSAPLVCQESIGGSIDPNPFRDRDGKLYLIWKNDGNCCGAPVHLWSQELSADGATLVGAPSQLMGNTKAWQGNLVEAPELVVRDGRYYLFYSANSYADQRYAIGYAVCDSPLGPCVDKSDQPLVRSSSVAIGPGHCYVIETPTGQWWLLFHAWSPDAVGSLEPGRQLWLEPLRWDGDVPSVTQPTDAPQPAPRI